MKIAINAIGKINSNALEAQIIQNYLKRLPFTLKINQLETKLSGSSDEIKAAEARALIASCNPKSFLICLDETGEILTSNEFSKLIYAQEKELAFVIGGASGLTPIIKEQADFILSLSKMTFTHLMARALLVEQIYRAYTIKINHPYHK